MGYTAGYPEGELKFARARYSFAVDGGVVGDIDLMPTAQIPANAYILFGFAEVEVVPTSGGAGTLAIKVEGAADIVAAAAVSGAPWSTVGRKSVIPVATGATSVKTTAARKIVATIGTADLTAGIVDVMLAYVVIPD